jgi:hypothetical protein
MTTTSHKLSPSSLTGKALVLSLSLMMVASVLFAAAPSAMAQQTNTGTATVTTPPPLTPQEQQQQDRLQSIIAATTRNLIQGQKQIDGLVYTPRWSSPVWVEPDSLSIVFAYCLPGEFADSGQHILGGSDLEVLESYALAVTSDLTGWLIVVENENENARLPAAVGVICSSDANDPEARTLSQQEQVEINNIIKQFITVRNTVINNVTQIINIINNVTTNQTGGPTPPTNVTGPPTNVTGPPTNVTGPPTNVTGPPTNVTGPPTNVTGPTPPPPTEEVTPGGPTPPTEEVTPPPPPTEEVTPPPPPTEEVTPPPTEEVTPPPPTEGGAEPPAEPPTTIDTLGQ